MSHALALLAVLAATTPAAANPFQVAVAQRNPFVVTVAPAPQPVKPAPVPTYYIPAPPVQRYYVVPVYQGPVYQNCGPRG